MINQKKTFWDHNHELEFLGVTKILIKDINAYVAKEQLKKTHTPAVIREKVLSYVKGKENNDINLPYNFCSNIHYTNKNKIYGLSEEDADNLQNLFLKIKEDMPDSLCKILKKKIKRNDEEADQLDSFLLSTENMKNLYDMFNDVILVDTTYKTNRFRMPLMVIAGINENGKTFLLGLAVLSSEKEDSVKWALQNFIDYFEGCPKIICTDSCPTLGKVIQDIMPESIHLLCAWHVEKNLLQKIRLISKIIFF